MAAAEATSSSLTSSQVAPQQYVLAAGTTLLTTEAEAIWEQALAKASSYLTNLLSDPNREALFADVFGRAGTDAATFAANLQALLAALGGDGLQIAVDLRSDGELAGAFAAYAASGHTGTERIYVNADKLNNSLLDVNLATSALLEEFGHALDWRLNGGADSPGDEGQLFAAQVSGVVLTADQRALIDAEDDTSVLTIEGVQVVVELATFTATTGTDNPVLSTDNDTVTVEATNQIQAADTFSGGAGTDTIAIGVVGAGVSVDLRAAAADGSGGFLSFEAIQFLNTSGTSTATFAAGQFDSGKIELTSSFIGTASTQGVVINLAAAGTFDASSFSFTTWSSGTDSFTLAGSSGNDTIVGSSQADSISGAAGNDSLSGGDGNDTIDGGTGNDRMSGGAGVDFFITSATGGSSTAASGNDIPNPIIIVGNTLTFANGVDIITDFTVGTDILSGRGTSLSNINNLVKTANTANRGYYAYGSWGTSTNVFTFSNAWSSTNNDLIFVVGDGSTLTLVTHTSYTILTDISGSIDTTAPRIISFTTTTANGSYKAGDSINITANTDENILAGGQITVTLNTGATVILTAATTGSTLTGTYTIAAGQTSADLTVSSFTIGTGAIGTSNATPRDAGFGNALTSTSVPSGVNNIAGSYAIVVDTTAPAALTLTAPADSGSSSSDGITKNSGFSISTPEANATWQYSTNSGSSWTAGSATSFAVADGTYNSGVIQVRQIDQAGNPGPITSSTASITIDTTAPTSNVGSQSAPLVEAGGASNATAGTAAATITVTKADALSSASFDSADLTSNGWSSADAGATYTKAGSYGTATFTIASGVVSYSLNNSAAATQALTQGQAAADGFGTLRIVDAAGNSSQTAEISFAITGANDFPVFSVLTPPVETTGRNSQTEISFAELLAQANATDGDGSVVAFQVAAVASGSLLIGSSAGTATAWAAGSNHSVNADTNLYWTPAAGQAGTLANPLATGAFSVYAVDNNGGLSASPVTATVNVVCFLAGTLIANPSGEQPIETLQPGDLISTAEGPRPVRFISRTSHFPLVLDANDVLPIRIAAGALGERGPVRDLYVSPDHAILVDGHLLHASVLVNGTTITRTSLAHWQQRINQPIEYLNIELERHQLITAEGLVVESFVDNRPRSDWDNYTAYLSLYHQELPIRELLLPRVKFKRQLSSALRRLLQQLADGGVQHRQLVAAG